MFSKIADGCCGKYGVICAIACTFVYAYLYRNIMVVNIHPRFSTSTEILRSKQSTSEVLTTSSEPSSVSVVENSSHSLFDVFNLTNLKMLQEMETDRNEFRFLLTPMKLSWKVPVTFKKSSVKWSMVVAIKSDYKRREERDVIRSTWGSLRYLDGARMEVIFVTGRPESESEQIDLWKENIQFGDILEVDQNETYHGIGLKALAAMSWVGENLPEEWMYFSADDDIYPDIGLLVEDVKKLIEAAKGNIAEGVPIICAYSYEAFNIPERGDTKWTISRDIYPYDLYPPFCLGGFYGMPVKLAAAIHEMSRHYPYYRMDDVFITGFMRLKVCDSFKPGAFLYDKRSKNCAISTKPNSNFKHTSMKRQRFEYLWRKQETALRDRGFAMIKRNR